MINVLGIIFNEGGRIYFFNPNDIDANLNQSVIVETERGLQYGKVVTKIIEKKKESLNLPLKNIIRIATQSDENKNSKNIVDSQKALSDARRLASKYKLNMKIIDASFTFEKEQLVYHFISESRIDFRELAKALAGIHKTRIELRQIGVRDKAKEVGGLGPCGRTLCCSDYLINFDSVSINMAKNQNLSLNPNKINGACGRLLCCLTYENDVYEEYRKELPNIGEKVKYENKEGRVVSLDILNKCYTFVTSDNEYIAVNKK